MRTIFPSPDGKYRWTYALSLYKNPTILWMILKIFFWIVFGLYVFSCLLQLGDSDFWFDGLWAQTKVFGIIALVMLGLSLVGYLIYALMMGGKYVVEFEMDETGVTHTQIPAQAEKARRIGALTAAAGALSGKPGVAGAGMLSASRSSMRSDFAHVRTVRAYKKRSVIKVNERLFKNQVYADGEDFDFVLAYITSRVAALSEKEKKSR